MKLWEISSEYRNAMYAMTEMEVDEQTMRDTLEAMSGDLHKKMAATAAVMLEIEGQAAQVEEVLKRNQARVKALEAKAASLRGYLMHHMELTDTKVIATNEFEIKLVKNPASLKVEDENLLPSAYFDLVPEQVIPEHSVLNKARLKSDLKTLEQNGAGVAGAHLAYSHRLSIK